MDSKLLSRPSGFSTSTSHCSPSSSAPSHPARRRRASHYDTPAPTLRQISLKNVAKLRAANITTSERSGPFVGRSSSGKLCTRRGLGLDRRFTTCSATADNGGSGKIEIGRPVVDESLEDSTDGEIKDVALVSGSPVVLVEAPALLKTAEPMPMMRPNRGLLKPGDAGRVIDRRPKNTWAIRFAVGSYLIDRKCFEPMESS